QGLPRFRQGKLPRAVRVDRSGTGQEGKSVTTEARGTGREGAEAVEDSPARPRASAPPRLSYLSGFANEFATEAVVGALPVGQNSPQRAPLGLYAEQLSGTPFTAPRHANRRSWLYRIRPSVTHEPFAPHANGRLRGTPFDEVDASPNQLRWDPFP